MSTLIIVRLHPTKPMDPGQFRNAIDNLQIKAFDLSVSDSDTGVLLGTAAGLAPVHGVGDDSLDLTTVQLIQHYADVTVGFNTTRELESVATAVIVANPPAGHPEYPLPTSFDLRLEVSRGTEIIDPGQVAYNIEVFDDGGTLPTDQPSCFGLAASTYLSVPPLPPAGTEPPALTLPTDGTPPTFDALVTAINAVLAKDPGGTDLVSIGGGGAAFTVLSPQQCKQIAAELIWNRGLNPAPEEPSQYGSLYTDPEITGVDSQDADTARQKFEGQQQSYQATNDATAARLAWFVGAASAAVACELMSATAGAAVIDFPVITGQIGTVVHADAVLTATAGGPIVAPFPNPLAPAFIVPAAYFYALTATMPPQSLPSARYDLARYATELKTRQELQISAGLKIVTDSENFSTITPAQSINLDQAARRLAALGSASGALPAIANTGSVATLAGDWLASTEPAATIDTGFWAVEATSHAADYLELVLQIVTGDWQPLIDAIKAPPLNVASVPGLAQVSDAQWRTLFLTPPAPAPSPNLAILPPSIPIGTPTDRSEAFINHLRKFFTVPSEQVPAEPGASARPAGQLGLPGPDIFANLVSNYAAEGGGVFALGSALDSAALARAVIDTFPADPAAQQWLTDALSTLADLYDLTSALPGELRFSAMEALYARGFTDRAAVRSLSQADFTAALTGTLAYRYANLIQGGPTGLPTAGSPTGPFQPINPDGSLIDCVPPEQLSPVGAVAYLRELLLAGADSTSADPVGSNPAGQLGTLLSRRRGPLGDLAVSAANLEVPIPVIDLVNESLEALAAAADGSTAIGGAVFDSSASELADQPLRQPAEEQLTGHDPATMFAAIAEHSAPAAVNCAPAQLAAYGKLAQDFSTPLLPYDQPIDLTRRYLCQLGSDRFSVMRHFRKDITEFVLDPDPADEPVGFQRQLWRYPVRFDIALEYLGITNQEYQSCYGPAGTDKSLAPWQFYGFTQQQQGNQDWTELVLALPQFLRRTGIDYCELVELGNSGFVSVTARRPQQARDGDNGGATAIPLPDCQPCDTADWQLVLSVDGDPNPVSDVLVRTATFLRLWRRLAEHRCPGLSMRQLADLALVLGMFDGAVLNPDFVRQLAAVLMLSDGWQLSLSEQEPSEASVLPTDRIPLLALWANPAAANQDVALMLLLEAVQEHAVASDCPPRGPEFLKIIKENLAPLALLAGFDPGTPADGWRAHPTHTLRFVEILDKIYRSEFTVGELLLLFTVGDHLDGDDPFPLGDTEEVLDDPLGLPDLDAGYDGADHTLWALRQQLLEVDGSDAEAWSWPRMVTSLVDDFGYAADPTGDVLTAFGSHFFPHHAPVAGPDQGSFSVPLALADTSPMMWNDEVGPFGYDPSGERLTCRLPLPDQLLLERLAGLRPLNPAEQRAVRDLYFAPRTLLAPFAAIFENLAGAADRLIAEPDEQVRFTFFQKQFAIFRRRCELIAEHLSKHVRSVLDADGDCAEHDSGEAWLVLRALLADGNAGIGSWQHDSGAPPAPTWTIRPGGSAFAALLGLIGTGLVGEYTADGAARWRTVGPPVAASGKVGNWWNAPVPTVLPALDASLSPAQLRLVGIRNGLALDALDGRELGGAEQFEVTWTGALLVECEGSYVFHAGPGEDGTDWFGRDCEPGTGWRVTLRRGQRSWTLLERNRSVTGSADTGRRSLPLALRRGAYRLVVELIQSEPSFDRAEDVCPVHTGFELRYAGPDTGDEVVPVPRRRLYLESTSGTLGDGIVQRAVEGAAALAIAADEQAAQFLNGRYVSSLRDIRRTYQRAFKSLLLVRRFALSARPNRAFRQSELGYLLGHPQAFEGTAYPRTGPATFGTHHAWFDPNLLCVADPYPQDPAGSDERAMPSPARSAALFDVWERLFDYTWLRADSRDARQRPAWLLFDEADEHQPDEPAELLRHLGVDLEHASLVLTYFSEPEYTVAAPDLEDERWTIRVWHAERWLRRLERDFTVAWIGDARPDLWAADQPGSAIGAPPLAGTANLTRFVQDGYFDNGAPHRYADLRALNDCLRERARTALLSYLCSNDRVPLPGAVGTFASSPGQLSDLLLQDVLVGTCERTTRIADALDAVRWFVQRARLGLEAGFPVTPEFGQLWDSRWADLATARAALRREAYPENWAEWQLIATARRFEAYQLLEDELRRDSLSLAVPGGASWWPHVRPPALDCLALTERIEQVSIDVLDPVDEGFGLLGEQQRAARPSWLAPRPGAPGDQQTGGPNGDGGQNNGDPNGNGGQNNGGPNGNGGQDNGDPIQVRAVPANRRSRARQQDAPAGGLADALTGSVQAIGVVDGLDQARLPLWLRAAVGLRPGFVRVAAAGIPVAAERFEPHRRPGEQRCDCGCGYAPGMDEYYFWLAGSQLFAVTDAVQQADAGTPASGVSNNPATTVDPTSAWEQPDKLPGLLDWAPEPTVHLYWSRVRHGEFDPPRRSAEGLPITPGADLALSCLGRSEDSLRFEVAGGVARLGYDLDPEAPATREFPGATPPGFRYDLSTDTAVVLPELIAAVAAPTPSGNPAGLAAYPYFLFHQPGAPLEPLRPHPVAFAVAGALRLHGQYEAALRWYELAYPPLTSDNTWSTGTDGAPDRSILLAYLETLLAWVDALLCRGDSAAAGVVLQTLSTVLGRRPNSSSPAMAMDSDQQSTVSTFTAQLQPINPRLLDLFDRVTDRAELLHRCQDGHRLTNSCGCGTDRGAERTSDCCSDDCEGGTGCCRGTGPYRFSYLVQKAAEAAGDVRSLGAALLAAFEKNDAEALAALRLVHERQLTELSVANRQYAWREADWQVQALTKTKEGAQARLRYYQQLVANGLNSGETGYEALTAVSSASRTAGNISEAIGQAMQIIPDIAVGVAGLGPYEATQLPIGTKLGSSFASTARIMNTVAEIAGTGASLAMTTGGWDRRMQDWQLQVETIGIELQQIQRQILAADRHRDAALAELNEQQQQVEHASEVLDFVRDKFSSSELYLYLQRETASQHRGMYNLARAAARRAERAFNYERGHTRERFVERAGWQDLHAGLVAGDQLQLAVRQMEHAYLEQNCREYELAKHISLRQDFPLAFLRIQQTGFAEIELPEWLFDLDYPGHYLRRIKNVTLSIPCVVGPYTGIHCRLTLLCNQTRIDPRLVPTGCCCARSEDQQPAVSCAGCRSGRGCCCTSCVAAVPTGYQAGPADRRMARSYAAAEAIATSGGQNDAGLFELSFRDERYLPFEFAGAVSRWRIELPRQNNRFDFQTLTDVVLHLNYTAREGGDALRAAADALAQPHLPGDGVRLLDVRQDLPDEWAELWQDARFDRAARLPIRIGRQHLPYLVGKPEVAVHNLEIFFRSEECDGPAEQTLTFVFEHEREHQDGECGCAGSQVRCVRSAEWPGLYHGVLALTPIVLAERAQLLGDLRFPCAVGRICDVQLAVGYQARARCTTC